MDLKKELGSVAEAVKKVMEAELSTKQKQIAKMAEPKHKIDAGDLAKLRAGHKPVKEEQEQIDEMGYSAKAARAGKDIGKPGKMFGKIAASAAKKYGSEERGKKVAGAVLKKLRMKEDEDFDITDKQAEQLIEAYEYDEENKLTFSEMLSIYKENGLSSIVEEPTEAEFNAEIKDQMDSFLGKKKQPKLTTGKTVGVKNMPEEVEIDLDEGTMTHIKLKSDGEGGHTVHYKGEPIGSIWQSDKKHGTWGYHHDESGDNGHKEKSKKDAIDQVRQAHAYTLSDMRNEEVEQVEERSLTKPEMKKKEEVVKSMKKKMPGFKERYGERAKSVMYATATRIAKKD